jgi:hypothetical protein
MRPLGKAQVVERAPQVRLVDRRVAGIRQRLVDAAPGHDIAAKEKAYHFRMCSSA